MKRVVHRDERIHRVAPPRDFDRGERKTDGTYSGDTGAMLLGKHTRPHLAVPGLVRAPMGIARVQRRRQARRFADAGYAVQYGPGPTGEVDLGSDAQSEPQRSETELFPSAAGLQ